MRLGASGTRKDRARSRLTRIGILDVLGVIGGVNRRGLVSELEEVVEAHALKERGLLARQSRLVSQRTHAETDPGHSGTT